MLEAVPDTRFAANGILGTLSPKVASLELARLRDRLCIQRLAFAGHPDDCPGDRYAAGRGRRLNDLAAKNVRAAADLEVGDSPQSSVQLVPRRGIDVPVIGSACGQAIAGCGHQGSERGGRNRRQQARITGAGDHDNGHGNGTAKDAAAGMALRDHAAFPSKRARSAITAVM